MNDTHIDTAEIGKFDALAQRWWDREGPGRALHDINPLRFEYVQARVPLAGADVLDVGCGGGILSESLAMAGARVTAIDASADMIEVARLHGARTQLPIEYRQTTAEAHAQTHAARYDAVTCMELLEHVPDPPGLLAASARMLKPNGKLIISTINRTPEAYLLAVLGAEYLLRLLPRGTHDYARFIRPAEMARWCREAGLHPVDLTGMSYNPITHTARLRRAVCVNYLACAVREG